jgi:hypothetical protein
MKMKITIFNALLTAFVLIAGGVFAQDATLIDAAKKEGGIVVV